MRQNSPSPIPHESRLRHAFFTVATVSAFCIAASVSAGCANDSRAIAAQTAQTVPTAETAPFPLVLPWDDAKPSFTDVSFLNDAPAGKYGHIMARGERFIYSKTGKPVVLTGAVFTFDSPFPDKPDADKVAARLTKFGMNAVRLHYFDHGAIGRSTIWDETKRDYRALSPTQLDRLDYFVAALKKHGIYVNINLKVARDYPAQTGIAAGLPPGIVKRVDYFYPPMIALQKGYAGRLLSHKNAYTGMTYATDPVVWNVEVNNENSMSDTDDGAALLTLSEPFRGELARQWNGWLAAKYGTTAKLRTAWYGASGATLGAIIAKPEPAAWQWQQSAGLVETTRTNAPDGMITLAVTKASGTGWHAQLLQSGLRLQDGKEYTLRFRARADKSAYPLTVNASRDREDWRNLGLQRRVRLGTTPETYEFAFSASGAEADYSRITFELGESAGVVTLSDISLREGGQVRLMDSGESLEKRTVALPPSPVGGQLSNWRTFLADTEIGYAVGMRNFLKRELGVQSMVTCSQAVWGRYTSLHREALQDYVDKHGYWDHLQVPAGDWDSVGNRMGNEPMTPVFGTSDTLTQTAMHRVAGRPLFVSEYNHPAPNEYAVETVPLVSVTSAFQGWSGYTLHEYGAYGGTADARRIQAYFAVGSDPNKMVFMPSGAILARSGIIAPTSESITAFLPAKPGNLDPPGAWAKLPGGASSAKNAVWQKRMRVTIAGVKDGNTGDRRAVGAIGALHWRRSRGKPRRVCRK